VIGALARREATTSVWALVVVGAALAIALLEPLWAAIVAAAGVAALLILVRPLVALPLLLVAVPFGTLGRASTDSAEPSTFSGGAVEVLVAVLAAAWLADGVRRRRLELRGGVLVAAIGGLAALTLLSVTYADDRGSAAKEALKWLELLLVLLAVVDLVRQRHAARWVIAAALVAGAAEAAYGAMQFVTNSGPAFFEIDGALRAYGNFDQPNPFGGYLATLLPLAVLMALCPANRGWYRLMCLGAGLAILGGIALSQSRGAWLGVAVAAVVLLLVWSPTTRRLLVPAVGGLVGLAVLAFSGFLPPALLERVAQSIAYFGVFDVRTVELTSENFSVVERMAHWQAGWAMFLDHPWLGVGAGNYAEAYPNYYVSTWLDPLGHAHNYYLNMLAELGILGGALLLLVLALLFRDFGSALLRVPQGGWVGRAPSAAVSASRASDAFWRAVLAGVLAALVVFCVHDLFDNLFVHGVNAQLAVLLGLGLVARDHLHVD
jgi:O-antigen ligase